MHQSALIDTLAGGMSLRGETTPPKTLPRSNCETLPIQFSALPRRERKCSMDTRKGTGDRTYKLPSGTTSEYGSYIKSLREPRGEPRTRRTNPRNPNREPPPSATEIRPCPPYLTPTGNSKPPWASPSATATSSRSTRRASTSSLKPPATTNGSTSTPSGSPRPPSAPVSPTAISPNRWSTSSCP